MYRRNFEEFRQLKTVLDYILETYNSNDILLEVRMTTYYVNGKRVTKEEIEKIEIQSETVKRILAEKITNKKSK